MSDIVERLRGLADLFEAGDAPRHVVLHMRAAADEIERLRAALEEAAKVAENASFQFTQNTPRSVEVVDVRHTIAAAIRALAKQSTTEEERA